MALVKTSLAATAAAGATRVTLTSGTSVAVGRFLKVDAEIMLVQSAVDNSTTQWNVMRGIAGTAAVAHANLAPAIHGAPADFTVPVGAPVVSYDATGAIAIPVVDTLILLTKAGVAAMTLAAPALDQTNTVTVVAASAQAHTITYTAGFYGDTTSSDVATFTAKVGSSITFRAQQGVWGPIALTNVALG